MEYRSGNPADLAHLETFIWQAIFPAFDHPDLTEAQRAANDKVVEEARSWSVRAMGRQDELLYVAHDEERKQLAGLIWAKAGPSPRIVLIVVARRYWGQGIAAKLLEEAMFWLGEGSPVAARVRHYNERAKAFFAKHGFQLLEEEDLDFPIPRVIMQRPAGYRSESEDDRDQLDLGFEFPEPETADGAPAEGFLDLTEPFAQIRNEAQEAPPTSKFPHIELEITTGEEEPADLEAVPEDVSAAEALGDSPPPFEFAFQSADSKDDEALGEEDPPPVDYEPFKLDELPDPPIDPTEDADLMEDALVLEEFKPADHPDDRCTNCGAALPKNAKFCPQCGHPVELNQVEDNSSVEAEKKLDSAEEQEHASELPLTGAVFDSEDFDQAGNIDWSGTLMTDFRSFFKNQFRSRITDYFGEEAVEVYENARRQSDFQQTVSTQLAALADWVRTSRTLPTWKNMQGYRRLLTVTEALIEFFLVEGAKHIHGGIWPQRLLRHQAQTWDNADLFALVMDYLDFDSESETVYTDFVRMPAKVLRNVTSRFLQAARDERVLFVCDQSLLGTGKDGYAMTDVAIYWRPVLQGRQRLLYQEIETLTNHKDHLRINGLYLDAGASLNIKIALLLRRLATMTNA
ncbi:MAG: GNAT family N-acetyltransferase [Bacteroidota bacterium]